MNGLNKTNVTTVKFKNFRFQQETISCVMDLKGLIKINLIAFMLGIS